MGTSSGPSATRPSLLIPARVVARQSVFLFLFLGVFGDALVVHVAPMVGITDEHFRHLMALINPEAVLWSEMVKPKYLLQADDTKARALLAGGGPQNRVLQLGGNHAEDLGAAVRLARRHGWNSFDLNLGCPSIETNAPFGASLVRDPQLVLRLVESMAEAAQGPVSIKTRIGVYDAPPQDYSQDSYQRLLDFLHLVTSTSAVGSVVIHARAAVLSGMSCEANREAPPLRYDFVYQAATDLKARGVLVTLNGGVGDVSLSSLQALEAETSLSGVMVGRLAVRDPMALASASARAAMSGLLQHKLNAIAQYERYAQRQLAGEWGSRPLDVVAPLILLFLSSCPGPGPGPGTGPEDANGQVAVGRASASALLSAIQSIEQSKGRGGGKEGLKLAGLLREVNSCREHEELQAVAGAVRRAAKDFAGGKGVFSKLVRVGASRSSSSEVS